jgi:hypothetical protein
VSGDSLVGGLIGISHAEVATCYTAGKVEGTAEVGGLIGSITASGVIPELEVPIRTSSSFWDVEISGQTASAGGGGKTTAEMQTARTFLDAGWDFVGETTNGTADAWSISEGRDYPRLSWELQE